MQRRRISTNLTMSLKPVRLCSRMERNFIAGAWMPKAAHKLRLITLTSKERVRNFRRKLMDRIRSRDRLTAFLSPINFWLGPICSIILELITTSFGHTKRRWRRCLIQRKHSKSWGIFVKETVTKCTEYANSIKIAVLQAWNYMKAIKHQWMKMQMFSEEPMVSLRNMQTIYRKVSFTDLAEKAYSDQQIICLLY